MAKTIVLSRLQEVIKNNNPIINPELNIPEKIDSNFLDKVKMELNKLDIILSKIITKIIKEKPDIVYFLGKSSHIFRKPFAIYFKELGIKTKIEEFNDNKLKGLYLKGELDKKNVEYNLGNLSGKKVFFIDETFSDGKGASTILEIQEILNYDLTYISLSHDPYSNANKMNNGEDKVKRKKIKKMLENGTTVDINTLSSIVGIQCSPSDIQDYERHKKNIQKIKESKKFIIGDYANAILFSRIIKKYYLTDIIEEGKIKTSTLLKAKKIKKNSKESNFPNGYEGKEIPCELEKYRKLIRRRELFTVRETQRIILKFLRNLNINNKV